MAILKMVILAVTLMLVISCSNPSKETITENTSEKNKDLNKLDQSVLAEYFLTNQITIDTLKHSVEININDSRLITVKKEMMGARWESPEPWVSVAATFQAKSITEDIDSLFYNISMSVEKYRYGYSVKQLQKANFYISICEQFANCLNSNDYDAIKRLLSVDITSNYNEVQLKDFIQSTFREEKIDRTELIGTKIIGSKYSFYINFWTNSNQVRTYAFSFLEESDKIAGVQIVR